MPFSEHHFDIQKIAKWFARGEVKTPLSFFFKVIPYMTAAWIAVLYAPGFDGATKFSVIRFSAWIFCGLCLLVALFAFTRPKHLVYGELGHRAEHKLEFGTEKQTYTAVELEQMPPGRNAQQLEGGDKPGQL
jgi:hypothetical protein